VSHETIDLTAAVESERARRLAGARGAFDRIVSWLTSSVMPKRLHRAEDDLWSRLLGLGCALVSLWAAQRLPTRTPSIVVHWRGRYRFKDVTTEVVRTRFGVVHLPRRTYVRIGGKGPATISPDDLRIGLAAGRMSLRVHLLVAHLAARVAFSEALEVMRLFGGYVPSHRAALGIVDELGPHAREYLDELPAPYDDGEILVIQVDSKGASMIRPEEHKKRCRPHRKRPKGTSKRGVRRRRRRKNKQPRRAKGDKSKNARMAPVAVVYTLRRLPDGTLEGPFNKRLLATFAGLDALRPRLKREAEMRGYGSKFTVFLADGAQALWKLWEDLFPKAIPCLDWFHLCEYMWQAGGTVHKQSTPELEAWVDQRKDELRAGKVDDVLAAMEALLPQIGKCGPGTKGRRDRLHEAIRYVANHREQLRYQELLAADIDIATGAVEGAVKHLIGARLDASGMRWSPGRAEHVLALRLVVLNGLWDEFEEHVMRRHERRRSWQVPRVTPDGPREIDPSAALKGT